MDIKSLQEQTANLLDPKDRKINLKTPEEYAILAKTVKLNEEVGELCNDILSILQLQRKSKLSRFEKKNMYQEFADVMIVLMQLASLANVDMERAVKEKIETIKTKYVHDKH
ncbi:MAG: MazG nucleotide pyrophosphohydrolase domain-containing protein [Weeksellaceae bacterium]